MDPVQKWRVRQGPGGMARTTWRTQGGTVYESPVSVDKAGWQAAGAPSNNVIYNGGAFVTNVAVMKVVGVTDPTLNVKPGDFVAELTVRIAGPGAFGVDGNAEKLGLKDIPGAGSGVPIYVAVDPANENPNLPPGPGNNPNQPPGNNPPPVPGPLPPGAVGRDQWGRAIDQYGRVIPETGGGVVVVQPPPVEQPKGIFGIDPGLFLMMSQQDAARAERNAAREDALMRADMAREERQERIDEERREEKRRERKQEEADARAARAAAAAAGYYDTTPPPPAPKKRKRRPIVIE